jgi:hypothetical protein
VTPTEIGVRVEFLGSSNVANYVFDHDWNIVNMLPWKYSPNDGQGIKEPLIPGSKWKVSNEATNTQSGASFHNSGTSEVLSKEVVTTGAGTFDAYGIETSLTVINTKFPAYNAVKKLMSWYAPSVARWVKQTTTISANGHVTQNTSVELVDYGRRQ